MNSINTEINNNKIINVKDNYNNNNIYKTENNVIINNEMNSPEKEKKEYHSIKLKTPPYKKLKIINNNEFEEKNKIKEERENNIYNQNKLAQKFNTIKNPLKQNDSKRSSVNISQSIPEIINNSDTQNSQNNNNKFNEKQNYLKNNYDINYQNNDFRTININSNYNNEKKMEDNYLNIKLENNYKNNINIKTNNNKDVLLLLKPNGYFFKKKPMKNLSTININKRPVSSIVSRSNLINNSDNINKIFDNYNSNIKNNNYNTNNKNLAKIKLKPISPSIRSITPFNENYEKNEKISPNKFKYNVINKKIKNSINDLNYNINDININNNNINNFNNDKRYFFKDKKNIRQLNFNKNKLNNLSQIKTKFINFIKPNYKNIEMMNHKTEI